MLSWGRRPGAPGGSWRGWLRLPRAAPPRPAGKYNERDAKSQLQWFLLTVCDPAASRPGALEAAGRGPRASWPRDRHTLLRWDALAPVLRRIAGNNGDVAHYKRQFSRQGWWFQMMPNATQFGRVGVRCSDEPPDGEVGPAPAPAPDPGPPRLEQQR